MRRAERHSQLKAILLLWENPCTLHVFGICLPFPTECLGPKAPGECCQVSHREKYIIYIYLKRRYIYICICWKEKRSILIKDDLFHVASLADLKFTL